MIDTETVIAQIARSVETAFDVWLDEYTGCSWFKEDKVRQAKEDALALIKGQTQIVRCKDCKHGQYEEWDNGECVDKTVYCDGYGIHKPDWFCADWERKEGR